MDQKTPNLRINLLKEFQEQKEITINEALAIIDASYKRSVQSIIMTSPPNNPLHGDIYYIPENAENEWATKINMLAIYCYGWKFLPIDNGYTCWVNDQAAFMLYAERSWVPLYNSINSTENNKK